MRFLSLLHDLHYCPLAVIFPHCGLYHYYQPLPFVLYLIYWECFLLAPPECQSLTRFFPPQYLIAITHVHCGSLLNLQCTILEGVAFSLELYVHCLQVCPAAAAVFC